MPRKKKEVTSPKVKIRQRKKKEVSITPRLRLEPRLTSRTCKKKSSSEHHENKESSMCFENNELEENISQNETCYVKSPYMMSSYEEQRKMTVDAMSSVAEENTNHVITNQESEVHEKSKEVESNNCSEELTMGNKKKKIRRHLLQGHYWSDRERLDLVIGLQAHGFADLKKLAEVVKTKNENEIRQFMRLRRIDTTIKPEKTGPNRQGNRWHTLSPKFIQHWPNIRKWRKLAYEQMLAYTRTKDYSKPVISALCKKFYEEEKEPGNPQVINVKLIYKYMMNCMAGELPPQLPPKESALVLDLLREVRLMPIAYDFDEEKKFLQDFRAATKFKPFQVKDEFRKRYKKESEDTYTPNTIAVPEEVFLDLSRHKRLTQSFSPLVTPVWMLQKEQELLEKHAEESNAYVD